MADVFDLAVFRAHRSRVSRSAAVSSSRRPPWPSAEVVESIRVAAQRRGVDGSQPELSTVAASLGLEPALVAWVTAVTASSRVRRSAGSPNWVAERLGSGLGRSGS